MRRLMCCGGLAAVLVMELIMVDQGCAGEKEAGAIAGEASACQRRPAQLMKAMEMRVDQMRAQAERAQQALVRRDEQIAHCRRKIDLLNDQLARDRRALTQANKLLDSEGDSFQIASRRVPRREVETDAKIRLGMCGQAEQDRAMLRRALEKLESLQRAGRVLAGQWRLAAKRAGACLDSLKMRWEAVRQERSQADSRQRVAHLFDPESDFLRSMREADRAVTHLQNEPVEVPPREGDPLIRYPAAGQEGTSAAVKRWLSTKERPNGFFPGVSSIVESVRNWWCEMFGNGKPTTAAPRVEAVEASPTDLPRLTAPPIKVSKSDPVTGGPVSVDLEDEIPAP